MTNAEAPAATTADALKIYADRIWDMIGEDMFEGVVPDTCASFSELHEYVDANEYMIQADVPWNPDDEQAQDFYVNVQDEITNRLAAHAGLTVGTAVKYYLGDTPQLHDGVITDGVEIIESVCGRGAHVTVTGEDGVPEVLHVSAIRKPAPDEAGA